MLVHCESNISTQPTLQPQQGISFTTDNYNYPPYTTSASGASSSSSTLQPPFYPYTTNFPPYFSPQSYGMPINFQYHTPYFTPESNYGMPNPSNVWPSRDTSHITFSYGVPSSSNTLQTLYNPPGNSSPFTLKMITSRISKCQGCKQLFRPNPGSVLEPPADLIVSRLKYRPFVSPDGAVKVSKTPHYHCDLHCLVQHVQKSAVT